MPRIKMPTAAVKVLIPQARRTVKRTPASRVVAPAARVAVRATKKPMVENALATSEAEVAAKGGFGMKAALAGLLLAGLGGMAIGRHTGGGGSADEMQKRAALMAMLSQGQTSGRGSEMLELLRMINVMKGLQQLVGSQQAPTAINPLLA